MKLEYCRLYKPSDSSKPEKGRKCSMSEKGYPGKPVKGGLWYIPR